MFWVVGAVVGGAALAHDNHSNYSDHYRHGNHSNYSDYEERRRREEALREERRRQELEEKKARLQREIFAKKEILASQLDSSSDLSSLEYKEMIQTRVTKLEEDIEKDKKTINEIDNIIERINAIQLEGDIQD